MLAEVSIPAGVASPEGGVFPGGTASMADREKPKESRTVVDASGSPAPIYRPLGHKAALAACSHELDLQRETHRWRGLDSNF